LSQDVIIDGLIHEHNLIEESGTKQIPYQSGFPFDRINENANYSEAVREKSKEELRSLVGSLN